VAISKTKLLVVDDDQKVLREVRSHSEKLGYEAAVAEDGIAALKLVQSMSPDLIVLDINFSDFKKAKVLSVDEVEVLRRLRESGNIPVLMLSSTTSPP
jgi:chemosensory pili system protein ChpA (sensor histidine kinase/response regulator)